MSGFVIIIMCVHAAFKAPSNDFMEHEVASDTGFTLLLSFPICRRGSKMSATQVG